MAVASSLSCLTSFLVDSETLIRDRLSSGLCLPIAPIAATEGRFDPSRQKILWRYYAAAGAGGAVADLISMPPAQRRDLLESLGDPTLASQDSPWLRVALLDQSETLQLAGEIRDCGFHALAISCHGEPNDLLDELVGLLHAVGETLPVILAPRDDVVRPGAGVDAWRRLLEAPHLVAVCLPANRTTAVTIARALAELGRKDVALYTANEWNPVVDLVTPFRYSIDGKSIERRVVGGMLRLWSVFTARAVELLERCHVVAERGAIPDELLQVSVEVSELSIALAEQGGAGFREVLARQKIFSDNQSLEGERPHPGVAQAIAAALESHPHLTDFSYVAARLAKWSAP